MQDIKDYEGIYAITTNGEIWSYPKESNINKKGKWLTPGEGGKYRKIGRGYKQVVLYKKGKKENRRIHRLVAETFIPNPFNKIQINHINGNTKNNHVSNLEWVTPSENINHAIKNGAKTISVKSREVARIVCIKNNKLKRKLSYETAQEIRIKYLKKKKHGVFRKLAKQFHTTPRIVTAIIKNKTYTQP